MARTTTKEKTTKRGAKFEVVFFLAWRENENFFLRKNNRWRDKTTLNIFFFHFKPTKGMRENMHDLKYSLASFN